MELAGSITLSHLTLVTIIAARNLGSSQHLEGLIDIRSLVRGKVPMLGTQILRSDRRSLEATPTTQL